MNAKIYLRFLSAGLILPLLLLQAQERSSLTRNQGSITLGNTYYNNVLGISLSLPGAWSFFDRLKYSTTEDRELLEKAQANCEGPLCGPLDVDEALQSPVHPGVPQYALYLTAHALSPECQDRARYPLRNFAEAMTIRSLGVHWIPDGELTPIRLSERPAYRLVVHNREKPTARGFLYVADANQRVFMLFAVALSNPQQLRSAVESMDFPGAAPLAPDTLAPEQSDAADDKPTPVPVTKDLLPTCTYTPNPAYSQEARAARFSGTVLVEAVVQLDGSLGNIRVLKSPGLGLDENVVETLKKWKCRPPIGPKGKPIPVIVPFQVNFKSLEN